MVDYLKWIQLYLIYLKFKPGQRQFLRWSNWRNRSPYSNLFWPLVSTSISWPALRFCSVSLGGNMLALGWAWEMCLSSSLKNSTSSASTLLQPHYLPVDSVTSRLPEATAWSPCPSYCSNFLAWSSTQCRSRKFKASSSLMRFMLQNTPPTCKSWLRTW